jgi:acetolactate synthase-1/2/3 large subunit
VTDNSQPNATGGQLVATLLAQSGVQFLFGQPGETPEIIQAFYGDGYSAPKHIVFRDERNAPYAAIAYTRLSGRLAALEVAPSVGSVMLPPGLAEAYNMSIPVLALITDVSSRAGAMRLYGAHSQASDQFGMLRPYLKYAAWVSNIATIPEHFLQALQYSVGGRPGPSALFIPSDVLEADASAVELPPEDRRRACLGAHRYVPQERLVRQACHLLAQAERPVILAGGGVLISDGARQLGRFSSLYQVPIATTLTGAGIIDETSNLSLGTAGYYGVDCATRAIERADTVFLIGAKSSAFSTMQWRYPRSDQACVHLDIDPTEPGKRFRTDIALVGDAQATLDLMNDLDPMAVSDARGRWLDEVDEIKRDWLAQERHRPQEIEGLVSSSSVMHALESRLGSRDVLVCDASGSSGWGARVRMRDGAARLACRGISSLGSSLGSAIGAALARPDATVVRITGDGGATYSLGELPTVARLGLRVVSIILNNSVLGAVLNWPGYPADAARLDPVDFAAIAEACGCTGVRVHHPSELDDALDMAFASAPAVVDIQTHPNDWPAPGA